MPTEPIRIAMWSGPRNISTAMMRSWGNRADTVVCDEPLYAHYLKVTGLDHPGAAEVIAHHETDWRKVVAWLTGPIENARLAAEPAPHESGAPHATADARLASEQASRGTLGREREGNPHPGPLPPPAGEGASIFYQKHMAHHLLPGMDLEWVDQLTNCFLIRSPREMITSLAKVIPNPTVEQTGLPQQVALFERECARLGESGGATARRAVVPAVVDSRDVLENPAGMLRALCARLGVEFDEAMLSWPPGPRETDGVWAKYWYDAVERSTGFMPYVPKDEPVPKRLEPVLDECERFHEQLHTRRITV